MRYALLALLLPWLGACQSSNPYTAQSNPIPPAPAGLEQHVDMSAYPAPVRAYGLYRNWSWYQGRVPANAAVVGGASLADGVSARLDQVGLRPAQNGQGDLLVRATLTQQTRTEQVYDQVGGYYGGGYHHHYGGMASTPIVRNVQRRVAVVQIDLIDAKDQQVVWSGSGEANSPSDRSEGDEAIRQAIARALDGYPPN